MADNNQEKQPTTALSLLKDPKTFSRIEELFRDKQKTNSFLTTMMSIVSNNEYLKNADPISVFNAAMTAASLDLSINPNLWLAYIVPYNNSKTHKQEAQFQMWYKGFKQLAIRSNQYKNIYEREIYDWQLIEDNTFLWFHFDWKQKKSDKIIGYACYILLLNGYEYMYYMSHEEMEAHALEFSQQYKKYKTGLWKTNFVDMALKTVIKLNISKNWPISTDIPMQIALKADQWIIREIDLDGVNSIEYADNDNRTLWADIDIDPELLADWERKIKACKTKEELQALRDQNKQTNPAILSLFSDHEKTL